MDPLMYCVCICKSARFNLCCASSALARGGLLLGCMSLARFLGMGSCWEWALARGGLLLGVGSC